MNLERGMRFVGRSATAYTLGEPLYPRFSRTTQARIWTAQSSAGGQVILKFRKRDTPKSRSNFQREIMQGHRFKHSQYIRQLLDTIDGSTGMDSDQGMVLEYFPETLWEVRESGRLTSFGITGIRSIMKDVLRGIEDMHAEGVIHLDVKAQNILLNGESAKLSDLGSTWDSEPASIGTVQPMPYRSPEVLFNLHWSKEVDIWSWGMVYLHMIQAYIRPEIWGLYDRLPEESTIDTTKKYEERVRSEIFHDFRLSSIPYYQQCEEYWPERVPERDEVTFRSILEYLQFPEEDIRILEKVLIADPRARPTAGEILHHGCLDAMERTENTLE